MSHLPPRLTRHRLTRRRLAGGLAATLLAAPARATAPDRLQLAQLVPLSGAAAWRGDAWRSGVEMAVLDINAAGGVLGRKIEMSTFDAGFGPAASLGRALEFAPYALLGTLSDRLDGMLGGQFRGRGVSQISGAEGGPADPAAGWRVLASLSLASRMARLARWLKGDGGLGRVVLCWTPDLRARRDAFLAAARAAGVQVLGEASAPPAALGGEIA
ncbi:MAG: ABC transporter substrate-binding protein, partial [Rhodospirillales bacterium]|nr:ABC transporter substrate-binding protein [Rhodospirillales bacterium]